MPSLANAHPRAVMARLGEASPRVVLVVMCVGYFLVLLDVTIVNVALPQIASGIGASVSGLQWIVDGYALALASLMLAGGTVGDLHGHSRVVLTGLVVFGVGSLACGLRGGDRDRDLRRGSGAASERSFLGGFHAVALAAACFYAVVALASFALIPGGLGR
jgi:MFS family permease